MQNVQKTRISQTACCFIIFLFYMPSLFAQSIEQKISLDSVFQKKVELHSNDYLATYLVDWRDVSAQYSHCEETFQQTNAHFLLGACPSVNAINMYYASTALIHYTAANLLPLKYSRILQESPVSFNVSIFSRYSSLSMVISY